MARPRMNKCTECRKRKKRCDGQQPGCKRDIMSPSDAPTAAHTAHHTPGMADAFNCAQLPVSTAVHLGNIFFKPSKGLDQRSTSAGQGSPGASLPLVAGPGYCNMFGMENTALGPQTGDVDMQISQSAIETGRRARVVHQNFNEIFNKAKRNKCLRPSLPQSAPLLRPATGMAGPRPVLARHPTVPYSLPKGQSMTMNSAYDGKSGDPSTRPAMYAKAFATREFDDSNKAIVKRMALPPLSNKPSSLSGSAQWQDTLPLACDSSVSTNGLISPDAFGLASLQSIGLNDCFGGLSSLAHVDLIQGDATSPFGLLSGVGGGMGSSTGNQHSPSNGSSIRPALSLAALNSVLGVNGGLTWESSEFDADWATMLLSTSFEPSDWEYGYGVRNTLSGAACLPSLYTPGSDTLPDLLGSTEA